MNITPSGARWSLTFKRGRALTGLRSLRLAPSSSAADGWLPCCLGSREPLTRDGKLVVFLLLPLFRKEGVGSD